MMIEFEKNMGNKINPSANWDLLIHLYNKYEHTNEVKIPKIIHQIWLGSEYPEKYKSYRDEMMCINSDWEYKLWTDKDVESFGLKNAELFKNTKNWGAKSDIFRYEILERIGGLYIDTDFQCIKNFSDLCDLDFYAGNGHISEAEVFNSIMASAPNHKYVTELVNRLTQINSFNETIDGVMNTTGPYFITRTFFDVIDKDDNVVIFPTKFFFPFPAVHRDLIRNETEKTIKFVKSFKNENTYAIHLWHTTWQ